MGTEEKLARRRGGENRLNHERHEGTSAIPSLCPSWFKNSGVGAAVNLVVGLAISVVVVAGRPW